MDFSSDSRGEIACWRSCPLHRPRLIAIVAGFRTAVSRPRPEPRTDPRARSRGFSGRQFGGNWAAGAPVHALVDEAEDNGAVDERRVALDQPALGAVGADGGQAGQLLANRGIDGRARNRVQPFHLPHTRLHCLFSVLAAWWNVYYEVTITCSRKKLECFVSFRCCRAESSEHSIIACHGELS